MADGYQTDLFTKTKKKIMSEPKKEKAILLAKEINDYSFEILEAVKKDESPKSII